LGNSLQNTGYGHSIFHPPPHPFPAGSSPLARRRLHNFCANRTFREEFYSKKNILAGSITDFKAHLSLALSKYNLSYGILAC